MGVTKGDTRSLDYSSNDIDRYSGSRATKGGGYIRVKYRDNGKEHGNYYLGFRV